jgi:ATP-dependent Clp protease ATP-binding subunit ClpC
MQTEAREMDSDHVGTEHLLLALVHEKDGLAAKALISLGLTREAIVAHLVEEPGSSPHGGIPETVRAKRAFVFADSEARFLLHDYVGTEHLLLGLMRESEEWEERDWPGPHHLRSACEARSVTFRDLRGQILANLNEPR